MIAKNLERIADHCTNIAEDVIYVHSGRIISAIANPRIISFNASRKLWMRGTTRSVSLPNSKYVAGRRPQNEGDEVRGECLGIRRSDRTFPL